MESTYIIFPIMILVGAIFMQIGSLLIERGLHPKIQTAIGGICIVLPLFVCSYITNLALFVALYSTLIGAGFGLLYMPALKNSWQYFPSKKGLISGLILSCYSIGAILWVVTTMQLANPHNQKPGEIYINGDKKENFYKAD